MDAGQREMAEREADAAVQLLLDALDLAERATRVRALVVAVLEDDRRPAGPAHVVDRVVQRQLAHGNTARQRHEANRTSPNPRGRSDGLPSRTPSAPTA